MCNIAVGVNVFLTFLGGTSPAFQYVEDKCDIPVANGASTDTTVTG